MMSPAAQSSSPTLGALPVSHVSASLLVMLLAIRHISSRVFATKSSAHNRLITVSSVIRPTLFSAAQALRTYFPMESPKRRKVAEGQALASAGDECGPLPSKRRDGMPHSSDVRAQEGPNFSVTAEAVVPEIEKPIPLPEALMMALPDLYETKTSAKKVSCPALNNALQFMALPFIINI